MAPGFSALAKSYRWQVAVYFLEIMALESLILNTPSTHIHIDTWILVVFAYCADEAEWCSGYAFRP